MAVKISKKLSSRIFNLVIGRVLKKAYLSLDENGRAEMERIFALGGEKEQGDFAKKHIPEFKKIFKEESKKIGEEIKIEVEKQV